jgi:hypothetical protein
MPTVFRLKGFRFFFFSNEDDEPPHIHIEYNDKYAKFWLDPVQLAKSVGYNATELSEIRNLITENSGILRRRWGEYFNKKD